MGVPHQKKKSLLFLENSTADIVLGRPWLIQRHPELSWETGEIKKWSDSVILPVFLHYLFIYRKNQERLQYVLPPSRDLLIGYLLTSQNATPSSKMSLVPRELSSYHLIGHGTAQLISFQVNQYPEAKYTP